MKENPKAFFLPSEWLLFVEKISDKLKPYFWILLLTGMRYNEAANIKKQDIDFKNKWIIVRKAKGGRSKIRYVSLSSFAIDYIKQFVEAFEPDDYLGFPARQYMGRVLADICPAFMTDGKDISTHNLRKTHENFLNTLNLPFQRITLHMGHNSQTAIEHYSSSAFIRDEKEKDLISLWLGDIFE